MENKNTTKTKNNINTVQNEPLTIEEIKNTIPDYIKDFCIQYSIDDLRKESSNVFTALLRDINTKLIKPNKKILYTLDGTNNAWNLQTINDLLDIYINLSTIYDNPVTILGFQYFTGLSNDIYNLKHETKPRTAYNNITKKTYTQSLTGAEIWQKLTQAEEQTTLNTRKYNDLRIIARLNRITGGAYRDYIQTDTGTAERPQLDGAQIANKYGALQGSENLPQLPTVSSSIDKN